MRPHRRARSCSRAATRNSRKPARAKILRACAITLSSMLASWPAPAGADGTIYGAITLTNNTNQPLSIPSSGASTPQVWGLSQGASSYYPFYVAMPDGSPPTVLPAGQTMLFGSQSNGGFLATTGTGGWLSIPAASDTITWSVPWAAFNGTLDQCSGGVWTTACFMSPIACVNGGASSFPSNMIVSGGVYAAGDNTCWFAYVVNPTSPAGYSSTASRNTLSSGQSISWPTSCPISASSCRGGNNNVTSTDGSMTLSIVRSASGLAASGGLLTLVGPGTSWSAAQAGAAVVAVMQSDGNFVAFDAGGKQVWSSGTSGHPGAFLSVDSLNANAFILVPPNIVIWSAIGNQLGPLPTNPVCTASTNCAGELSISCTGPDVGVKFNGNCHDTYGESTPCLAGFTGASTVSAGGNVEWIGSTTSPNSATVCTMNAVGQTCIVVTTPVPTNCPQSPPSQCGQGQRLCTKYTPPICVPEKLCLVQGDQPPQ